MPKSIYILVKHELMKPCPCYTSVPTRCISMPPVTLSLFSYVIHSRAVLLPLFHHYSLHLLHCWPFNIVSQATSHSRPPACYNLFLAMQSSRHWNQSPLQSSTYHTGQHTHTNTHTYTHTNPRWRIEHACLMSSTLHAYKFHTKTQDQPWPAESLLTARRCSWWSPIHSSWANNRSMWQWQSWANSRSARQWTPRARRCCSWSPISSL